VRHGKKLLVLLALLVFGGTACAEDQKGLPEAPSHHDFWDGKNRTLFLIHGSLEALDFGITHHNLSRGGRELNPTGKALCESGTAGQLVFLAEELLGCWESATFSIEPDTTNWSAPSWSSPASTPHME
jgi:hypothetical protein